jgi:hypothetical protein
MIIDTIRPVAVIAAGGGTAVPSGTLASVTSDDLDSTYINFPVAGSGNRWTLRMATHTLATGYRRNGIRARFRSRVDAGSLRDQVFIGRQGGSSSGTTVGPVTDAFAEYMTPYFASAASLWGATETASDLVVTGGVLSAVDTATALQIAEIYVDIDTRFWPDFSPQVQDSAGNDFSGGTITTTVQPLLFFGAVGYDGLPEMDWSVAVKQGAATVFTASGSGIPPATVPVTVDLPDAVYTAQFTVRSLIGFGDPFPRTITVGFTIHNVVPPPSPPLVTVTPQNGGYLVEWAFADGQPWDDDYVVAEVWRDDCTGSQRIAVVADGLTGSYFDLAIPQLDPVLTAPDCEPVTEPCDITYRVRYWGYVSTTITVPDTIPDGLILAWPGTAATIPSGWARVTNLDTRYPRGATGITAPTATGGAASHTHNAPEHTHSWFGHQHTVSAQSGLGGGSVNVTIGDLGYTSVPSLHTHDFPNETAIVRGGPSGPATPATTAVNNTPPTREVIWVQAGGGQTSYPVGILAFSLENVSAWTADAASSGRYLRGAPAAGNGGLTYGSSSHTHTINAHSHTGLTHTHQIEDSALALPVRPSNAYAGDNIGEFKPRHRHPLTVASASTGNTGSNSGGTTGSNTLEPPHRRLRVLRNVNGGRQIRIIGLYVGAIADLNANLTLCNGQNGTPDMRGWFVREASPNSVNTTGGTSSHSHSTPNHGHTTSPHQHSITVGTSQNPSRNTRGSAPTGSQPTPDHTHGGAPTDPYTVPVASAGAGTTTTTSHLPTYREVHFVRVDGIVAGGPLPAPELKISEFAAVTVPAFTYNDGLDRLATLDTQIEVATDRAHELPRIVTDSTPLDGGLHTVSTTEPGDVISLTIGVQGKADIDQLETVLSADRVYYSPVGGQPGWYAPAGWTVANPAPGVWAVAVQMTRQPWPTVLSPEEFL